MVIGWGEGAIGLLVVFSGGRTGPGGANARPMCRFTSGLIVGLEEKQEKETAEEVRFRNK